MWIPRACGGSVHTNSFYKWGRFGRYEYNVPHRKSGVAGDFQIRTRSVVTRRYRELASVTELRRHDRLPAMSTSCLLAATYKCYSLGASSSVVQPQAEEFISRLHNYIIAVRSTVRVSGISLSLPVAYP
jgi:hypothetical protein